MRSVLEKRARPDGRSAIEVGDKIGGKIEKVTDKLVHLLQLTGAEYFDGGIDVTHVSGVVVRTKAK